MQKTILGADFTDYQFTDREIEYNERMNILRNEYSGSLLIIDDLLCTDRNIDELQNEHSIQELISMGIQVIFITRQPVKANGYEVKALDPVYQLLMMRDTLRNDCTDEQLLGLSRAVNGNTAILYLIATILRKSWGRITPEQLLSSLRNDSSMRGFGNTSSCGSDYIITAAMRSLIGLSASDNEDHMLLQFAALLPEGGLDAIMFRNCLSRQYKPRLKQLIDQNFLIHKKGVLTVPTFMQDSILIPNGFHSAHFDAFLDELWYALDLNQYDSVTVEQLAKIYSKAADTLEDLNGEYAFRAARLWEFVGDLSQALRWMKRTLHLRKSRLPANDPDLASIYIDAGTLYLLLNEVEDALKHFREAVYILERIRSTDDPDLATCYSVVGDCYYQLKSYPIALDFQEKALAIFEKNVPADHPNRIIAHNRLTQLKK